MEQSKKKNAERYLVITKSGESATVWAEDWNDVLRELDESAEVDAGSSKEDVKLIMMMD